MAATTLANFRCRTLNVSRSRVTLFFFYLEYFFLVAAIHRLARAAFTLSMVWRASNFADGIQQVLLRRWRSGANLE